MAREQLQNLTEPMYYILLCLTKEQCGVDIMKGVECISKGRIKVGPGTLYALLGRFEKEGIIVETKIISRKKSYIITEKGKEILKGEFERLQRLIVDGNDIIGGL